MWGKYTAKWGVQIGAMIFQTRPRTQAQECLHSCVQPMLQTFTCSAACCRVYHSLIREIIIFRSISSSERKGDRSSKGGEIRVPSGRRFAEDLGSKF
ncbi:DUF6783 domain-containing protein [Lacrimispora indolis]|uniref:DUF6783 domain-containing protein n=1 Tax=Lacrimispora indolis TaxID=69825 RepID=UPI003F68F200